MAEDKPQVFLSVTEAAEFLGITKAAFLKRQPRPEPDAAIGRYRGWTEDSLREWDEMIPGPGPRPRNRTSLDDKETPVNSPNAHHIVDALTDEARQEARVLLSQPNGETRLSEMMPSLSREGIRAVAEVLRPRHRKDR